MNRYGQMALDYNRRFRPKAFAEVAEPERFFAAAGEEMQAAIGGLHDEILGRQRAGETPEEYRLRSYQALRTAEEVVLADHHLLTAAPESSDPESSDGDPDIDPELTAYYRTLLEIHETIPRLYE